MEGGGRRNRGSLTSGMRAHESQEHYGAVMRVKLTLTGVAGVLLALAAVPALADTDELISSLKILAGPDAVIGEVLETPMPGVYEVVVGNQLVHAYSAGKLVLVGEIYDVERRVSLKDEKANEKIASAVASVPVESMLVIAPEETKRYITVYTDVDCGFCRRFHRQIPDLMEAGVEVRYMAYPRAGIGSSSYDVIVAAWCADDQVKAITMAKNGEDIPPLTCENPVRDHYAVGVDSGIQGTPTIIFDDGTVVPGYLQTQELLARLGLS